MEQNYVTVTLCIGNSHTVTTAAAAAAAAGCAGGAYLEVALVRVEDVCA